MIKFLIVVVILQKPDTVEPRYKGNDFLCPSNSKIYKKDLDITNSRPVSFLTSMKNVKWLLKCCHVA